MIKSLKGINFESIFQAFTTAFNDYEMQVNKAQLQTMLQRRGFVPELSFAVFENDKIISFTFNGIGTFKGLKTAYDTGTGTIKEFRGKGLASKIFQHSIPFLKVTGIPQYLLEVLQHNVKAVSVYKNIGFRVSREFNYFSQKCEDLKLPANSTSQDFRVKTVDLTEIKMLSDFMDFNPSWQNSFESIFRKPEDFIVLGIVNNQKILGYCIFDPISGDVTQIAVHKKYRRNGIGTLLINEMEKLNRHHSIKIINTEIDCESINGFLQYHSISLRGKQFEMIKIL